MAPNQSHYVSTFPEVDYLVNDEKDVESIFFQTGQEKWSS